MTATSSPSTFDLLPACASSFGDDEFGVWCEIALEAPSGGALVVQRFRWIEPGGFGMGSRETEVQRSSEEGPRHQVTLTCGFWIADTACTQRMWSAVMGNNPSRFKGDDRPVEQISWRDVRAFLARLSALLPECETDLPTEAEWEYACRAGTETPFSFGETISPEQVNYDGSHLEEGGATVPVKSLPANPWGLYEMHGNVWEWCADGRRQYSAAPTDDPRGPDGPDANRSRVFRGVVAPSVAAVSGPDSDANMARVFRGGSWHGGAGRARSAYRGVSDPGISDGSLGFRFCLRLIEPRLAKPGQGSPAEQTPRGARGAGR